MSEKLNETGTGAVMGALAPMGLETRKDKVDEILLKNEDIGYGHMAFFIKSLTEEKMKIVCELLDNKKLDEVAEMCREAVIRHVVRGKINELVKKKKGTKSTFILYPPHSKDTEAKKIEFTSQLSAKRAELSRFPPKDAGKLKKLRKKIEKLSKEPEKKEDKKESIERKIIGMALKKEIALRLSGALVKESLTPNSDWDKFLDALTGRISTSDPKLKNLNKRIMRADTAFDKRAAKDKRDKYLDRLEAHVDSFISSLNPLALSILKRLLVQKYRSSLS
jgi:hypothetical protein